jgi:hypothetical protein
MVTRLKAFTSAGIFGTALAFTLQRVCALTKACRSSVYACRATEVAIGSSSDIRHMPPVRGACRPLPNQHADILTQVKREPGAEWLAGPVCARLRGYFLNEPRLQASERHSILAYLQARLHKSLEWDQRRIIVDDY